MKNPKLQYNKGGNNYYVYVPKSIVSEQKLIPGKQVNLREWAKSIGEENGN